MALINCLECEKQISDQAISCPHCGIPRSKIVSNVHNSIAIVDGGLKQSKDFLNKKFWFSSIGRISRSQYIIGFVIIFLSYIGYILFIDMLSDKMVDSCRSYQCFKSVMNLNIIVKLPFFILFIYIFTILTIKRFHDICKSGYQTFLLLIPIVGFYYLFILLSEKGTEHKNMYDNH